MLSFPAALRQVVQSVRNNAKLSNNAPAQCFENQVLASLLSAFHERAGECQAFSFIFLLLLLLLLLL